MSDKVEVPEPKSWDTDLIMYCSGVFELEF